MRDRDRGRERERERERGREETRLGDPPRLLHLEGSPTLCFHNTGPLKPSTTHQGSPGPGGCFMLAQIRPGETLSKHRLSTTFTDSRSHHSRRREQCQVATAQAETLPVICNCLAWEYRALWNWYCVSIPRLTPAPCPSNKADKRAGCPVHRSGRMVFTLTPGSVGQGGN